MFLLASFLIKTFIRSFFSSSWRGSRTVNQRDPCELERGVSAIRVAGCRLDAAAEPVRWRSRDSVLTLVGLSDADANDHR